MLAVKHIKPSIPTPWPRSRRNESHETPFSIHDLLYLISCIAASLHSWSGSRLPDSMPKKHQNPSPKPPKSSNTRTDPTLAVRQTSVGPSGCDKERHRADAIVFREQRTATPRHLRPSLTGEEEGGTSTPTGQEKHQEPANTVDTAFNRGTTGLRPTDYIDTYVEYRKRLFVQIFMEKLNELLDEHVCPLEEAYDHEEESTGSSKPPGTTKSGNSSKANKPTAGIKRHLRGEDRDEDHSESDEKSGRDRNNKRAKTDVDDDRQKFACPFYKHDPVRYKNHRSCVGPGWTELHRLKEHLYRRHRLYTCERCFGHFKDKNALQSHVRAKEACTVREKGAREIDPGAGMNPETEKQLRSRKPCKQSKKNEVERWYEIYHICFPDADIANLPSPWYDDASSMNGKNPASSSDELGQRYRRFLRRRIPSMIREELEAEVAKSFNDVNNAMKSRLANWIRDSAARCAKIFEYIPSPSEAAAQGDPEAAGTTPREGSPAAAVSNGFGEATESSMLAEVDWEALNMNLEFPFSFDEYAGFESCMAADYDSAYGTRSVEGSSRMWRV
ncbi:hypothetical protein CCHL11_03672 [Colletotrichum chlorophyti]|uniref:C2H2-type domain-containing protein n=1 Tax=Colletotrichum chlorophyti TaxID=708187 RepID=A0A1Q8RSN7_9PEZI|nr:hypothetical protein CCHL11_03672 [Colletotrichum chlorophyti]